MSNFTQAPSRISSTPAASRRVARADAGGTQHPDIVGIGDGTESAEQRRHHGAERRAEYAFGHSFRRQCFSAPVRDRSIERHGTHTGCQQHQQEHQHQIRPHHKAERKQTWFDEHRRGCDRVEGDRLEQHEAGGTERETDQYGATPQQAATPAHDNNDHRHRHRAGDEVDDGKSGTGRLPDPVWQRHAGDLNDDEHHGHARDQRGGEISRQQPDPAAPADRNRDQAPQHGCDEERPIGRGQPCIRDMTNREDRAERARIGTLHDRQPQQKKRLEDRADPAGDEGHAIDIGDIERRKFERQAKQRRENEHTGHAEHVLETQQN